MSIKVVRQKTKISTIESWATKGELYALVDSHFGPWRNDHCVLLNPKDTDPELYDVIAWGEVSYRPPSLMKITKDDLGYIKSHLITDRWGLLIHSQASLEVIARHFQKFVICKGPDGDPYFFKFQDAAVLEVFMETWNDEEVSRFLGPASSLGVVDLEDLDFSFYSSTLHEPHIPKPETCLVQLRQSQLSQCHSRIENDLVKIIGWHLRHEHNTLVHHLQKETLESRVLFGIRKARTYNLETVADLAGFVGLLFEIAPNFDQHPKINEVLGNHRVPADKKLDYLIEKISEKEWNEASELYDERAWPREVKKTGS